ncbi:MAG: hypothetical protein HRT88_21635 [Lentisphaeraceae bacterium]|nr:hypothetical protein [Lentisphaeraceae bacterium]
MEPRSLFLIVLGLFAITGAVFDWDWFMNSKKAQVWLNLFGRQGTRFFYAILGLAISTFGILLAINSVA